MCKTTALILATALLAACSGPRSDTSANTPAATSEAVTPEVTTPEAATPEVDYLGRWTGVEGMYLLVAAKPGGGVTLEMQWDLDNKGTFDGSVTAEGLRFMRNGVAESAVHTRGDATGLKYLADKQDRLTVRPGEGYCRDRCLLSRRHWPRQGARLLQAQAGLDRAVIAERISVESLFFERDEVSSRPPIQHDEIDEIAVARIARRGLLG